MLLYPSVSPARNRLPASQFRGESGAACASNDKMARHTLCSVQAGDHALFKMSRQISPVCGWNAAARRVGEVSRGLLGTVVAAPATQGDTSPSSGCWGGTPAGAHQASRACHVAAVQGRGFLGTHLGDKLHLRRRQRVLVRYVERQLEGAALIRRARRPLDESRRGVSATSKAQGTQCLGRAPAGRLSTCRCWCRLAAAGCPPRASRPGPEWP